MGNFHSDINWTKIYSKPFKTTSDTKLRWFQCRLLHRMITTNMFLLTVNKAENNLCTFCKGTPETTVFTSFWGMYFSSDILECFGRAY